jgi:hypothetical protein
MKHINGKQVFEFLSSMTDEQRERCVFPGFFDDEEYDILVSEVANNADLDDGEYDKALATDRDKMAKWTQDAVNKFYEAWGEYVQQVRDEVAWQIVNEAKRK